MPHNHLVVNAFNKAVEVLENQGVVQPSKKATAEVLADYIYHEFNFQFGERRLRDYFNAALADKEVAIAQQDVRDGLARYLGFENFAQWLVLQSNSKEESPKKRYSIAQYFGRNKTTLLIGFGCFVLFLAVNVLKNDKWMEWNGNEYVITSFDKQKLEKGEIWPLDNNRIDSFKRIDPDCQTSFFDFLGNAKIWYGKNHRGSYEYFTDLGRHPETGKTLKAMTQYMINTYVCPVSSNISD